MASLDITSAGDSIQCDIQSADSVNAAARQVHDTFGAPDILVHSAAVNVFSDTMSTTEEQFNSVMRVNVLGAILLTQAFAPEMRERGRRAIVHVSSITGIVGAPGLAIYSASKGALITLTRTTALELAESGVRVNCVCPASVDSPMLQEAFDRQPDPRLAREANIKRHPLGRLGTPEDVARLVLFLASEEASWITGGTYVVDGGASIARGWRE
ncbi:MAG: SDR family oxidoreductase [bacterium]|nr:SDR family oxidoreductase [bacterium]